MTSLLGKAEGFSMVLSLQPTLEVCRIRQEVFSNSEVKAENQTEGKNLMEQVEVKSPETPTSNSVILKIKRPLCSPQKMYPLRRRKIGLDTWTFFSAVKQKRYLSALRELFNWTFIWIHDFSFSHFQGIFLPVWIWLPHKGVWAVCKSFSSGILWTQ